MSTSPVDDGHDRQGRRAGRCAVLGLTVAALLAVPLGSSAPTSADVSTWTPTTVLLGAPAAADLAATSTGDTTSVFAGDRLLRGVRGRWTASRTPLRGARVLAAAADATGTVVAFETTAPGVPSHAAHRLWVARHTASGLSRPTKVAQPVNSGPLARPALLVRDGRWRVYFNEADCVDTACGENAVVEVTDTGSRRRLATVPGAAAGSFEGRLDPLDAALLPGGVVVLVGRDDDTLDGGSAVRDRGPLWFGRGEGASWAFAPLDRRADVTSSHVVGRYGGLFVVHGRPGQVVERTSDGRRWAAPRTLPAGGRPSGVRTAVSLGRQFLLWDDDTGLHLASRTIPGSWTRTTVTRAGRPRSLGLTAVHGKATVVYGVTTGAGLEVRARTQR